MKGRTVCGPFDLSALPHAVGTREVTWRFLFPVHGCHAAAQSGIKAPTQLV
jgi:hypothetical protein